MKLFTPIRILGIFGFLAALVAPAAAHEGEHSEGLALTLQHMLSSPDHLAMLLAAVGAGVGLAYFGLRARRSR